LYALLVRRDEHSVLNSGGNPDAAFNDWSVPGESFSRSHLAFEVSEHLLYTFLISSTLELSSWGVHLPGFRLSFI
jgi:hypothetical protein